jgi:hypothetical protein
MPITGVLNPNELIIYRPDLNGDTNDPAYARFNYSFEGLPTNPSLNAGEIIAACRAVDVLGTPLPGEGDPPPGFGALELPQTRVRVLRYHRQTGQARITVEWGVRYSTGGGGAPSLTRIRTVAGGTKIDQPLVIRQMIGTGGTQGPVPDFEVYRVLNRQVPRGIVRETYSKLVTFSGGLTPELISQIGSANYNRQFVYLGTPKILVSVSTTPISSVQGYVNTEFIQYSPVPEVGEADAVDTSENFLDQVNLSVAALGYNDEYAVPTTSGTTARLAGDIYAEGNIASMPWL